MPNLYSENLTCLKLKLVIDYAEILLKNNIENLDEYKYHNQVYFSNIPLKNISRRNKIILPKFNYHTNLIQNNFQLIFQSNGDEQYPQLDDEQGEQPQVIDLNQQVVPNNTNKVKELIKTDSTLKTQSRSGSELSQRKNYYFQDDKSVNPQNLLQGHGISRHPKRQSSKQQRHKIIRKPYDVIFTWSQFFETLAYLMILGFLIGPLATFVVYLKTGSFHIAHNKGFYVKSTIQFDNPLFLLCGNYSYGYMHTLKYQKYKISYLKGSDLIKDYLRKCWKQTLGCKYDLKRVAQQHKNERSRTFYFLFGIYNKPFLTNNAETWKKLFKFRQFSALLQHYSLPDRFLQCQFQQQESHNKVNMFSHSQDHLQYLHKKIYPMINGDIEVDIYSFICFTIIMLVETYCLFYIKKIAYILLNDLKRKEFLLIQLSYLISPKKIEALNQFYRKKILPTLTMGCPISIRSWGKMRQVVMDYAKVFENRSNFFHVTCNNRENYVFYDAINEQSTIHQGLIMNNKIIFTEISLNYELYSNKNIKLKSCVYSTLINSFSRIINEIENSHVDYVEYTWYIQEQNQNLIQEIDIYQQYRPMKVTNIVVSKKFMKTYLIYKKNMEIEGEEEKFDKLIKYSLQNDDFYQYLSNIKHNNEGFMSFQQFRNEQMNILKFKYIEKESGKNERDRKFKEKQEEENEKKKALDLQQELINNFEKEKVLYERMKIKENELKQLQSEIQVVEKQRQSLKKDGINILQAKTQEQRHAFTTLIELKASKSHYRERRQYEGSEKKTILDTLQVLDKKQVESLCGLHRNTIDKWKKSIDSSPKNRGRPLSSLELEEALINVVKECRTKKLTLTQDFLKDVGMKFITEKGLSLKMSDGFLDSFITRNKLKRRVINSKKQKFQDQQVIEEFIAKVNQMILGDKYDLDHVMNFDESGIFKDSPGNYTYSLPEEDHVVIKTNGNDKKSYTIGLTITFTGIKLNQVVVWPSKGVKKIFDQIPSNIIIFYRNEGSFFDSILFKKWIQDIVKPHSTSLPINKKGLIILDNFEGHKYEGLSNDLEQIRYEILHLPPNTTDQLQPLDIGVNRAYKQIYRKKWNYLQYLNRDDDNSYSHTQFLQQLSDTWKELKIDTVINSWNIYKGLKIVDQNDGDDSNINFQNKKDTEIEIYMDDEIKDN
ncbi:hypothetical protein ABPG72_016886 [Tetrahymena utriculariae]